MTHDMPSRRLLLKAGLMAGGGMMLGLRLAGRARAADAPAVFEPNAFLRIGPDGVITLILPHTEVGQGIYTSSAMLMAEELEIGLDQIAIEPAPPDLKKYMDPLLFDQATGGSASTRADWMRLREAAAAARLMLIAAAAKRWGVDPVACRVQRGVVHHDASDRKLGYGEVASDAAQLVVPQDIKLKDPSEWKLIGTSAKRIDVPAKTNGTAVFGIDIKVPGMRIGTLAITPVKGGKLVNVVVITADDWSGPGWSEPASRVDLLARLSSRRWAPQAHSVFRAPDAWLKWALYETEPLASFARGAAALLGDAAHAILPFLAQGAAMAIEDAAVAAQCLARMPDDPAAAWESYSAIRRRRTRKVQWLAARNGKRYHRAGAAAMLRNTAMRLLGGERLLQNYDWLYDWRPPAGLSIT